MTDIAEKLATLVKSIPQPFKEHAREVRASVLSNVESLHRELAVSQAREKVLRAALIDCGQVIAWLAFGDCRAFAEKAIPLAGDAIIKAKYALSQTDAQRKIEPGRHRP